MLIIVTGASCPWKISIVPTRAFLGKIDFITANIILTPLKELFPLFSEILNYEGRLVITGITPKQCNNFSKICDDFHLKLLSERTELNWSKMEFEKFE